MFTVYLLLSRPAKSPHIPAVLQPGHDWTRGIPWSRNLMGGGGGGGSSQGGNTMSSSTRRGTTSPSPAINWSFHQCGDSSPVLRPALVRPPELCRCRSHTFRKNGHFVGFTTSLEPRRTRANLPPAGLLPTNLTLMMAMFATFSGDVAKMDFKVELKKWALERSTRKEH